MAMDRLKARVAAEVQRATLQIQIPTDNPDEYIVPAVHTVSDLHTRIRVEGRYFSVIVKEDM